MNSARLFQYILFIVTISIGWKKPYNDWISEKHGAYTLNYQVTDQLNKEDYLKLIDEGIKSVTLFFQIHSKGNLMSMSIQTDSLWTVIGKKIGRFQDSNPNAGWLPAG
jgi:hypothetical protein